MIRFFTFVLWLMYVIVKWIVVVAIGFVLLIITLAVWTWKEGTSGNNKRRHQAHARRDQRSGHVQGEVRANSPQDADDGVAHGGYVYDLSGGDGVWRRPDEAKTQTQKEGMK